MQSVATNAQQRFGALIADARKQLRLRQRDVADPIGGNADANGVSRWERGDNLPAPERVQALITALGLDAARTWQCWGEAQLPASAAPAADDADRRRDPDALAHDALDAEGLPRDSGAPVRGGRRRAQG